MLSRKLPSSQQTRLFIDVSFPAPCKGTQILLAKSSVLHLAFDDTAGIPAK